MKNWQNRTVAVRLYLMAGLIGVVVAALVGLGYLQQRHSDEMLTELTEVELQRMQEVSAWQLVSTGTTVRMVALNRSQDPALAQLFGPEIGPRVDEIGRRYERIKSWAVRPDEVAILKVIDEASPVIIDAMKRIDAARQAGDAAAARAAFENGFMPPVQRYHEAIDRLAAHQQERLTQSLRASQAHQWQLFLIGAALVVLVVALVAAMVMRLVRYIQRSLDAAVQVAEQVAAGDLVVHMPPGRADEFGALMGSLGTMAASLHRLVQQVRQGTARISSVSGGLETGNQNLAERTDQQVTNLQLTAATMDALAATVRQSADNAEEARTLAAHASTVAERGGEVVGRVVQTMEQIEHSSRRIEEIIGVIDGIAFQTNILALNAAVEAARAGEQGRGFAVVAGEVRSLAQRSATAAREIKSLIVASSGNVRTGCSQVEAAGQTMTELVASVQKVSALIGDISSASEEQRLGIDGVTESVNQIDQATQQNAMLVQEAAAAAGQLDQQAAELARAVEAFRLRDTMPA